MKAMTMLGRFGRVLFALAIIGIGVETLVCAYVAGHSGVAHKIVPVIPLLPPNPALAYPIGAIFIVCGAGLLSRRSVLVSAILLGAIMSLCGLAFNVPRHLDVMSPEWRTNALEPVVIGCLAF